MFCLARVDDSSANVPVILFFFFFVYLFVYHMNGGTQNSVCKRSCVVYGIWEMTKFMSDVVICCWMILIEIW